jgi:hypothetical protein
MDPPVLISRRRLALNEIIRERLFPGILPEQLRRDACRTAHVYAIQNCVKRTVKDFTVRTDGDSTEERRKLELKGTKRRRLNTEAQRHREEIRPSKN